MAGIDLVTVFFGLELPFMELQAQSIDKCFDRDLVDRIIVVVNEPTLEQESATAQQFEETVRSRYGRFADSVVLLRASQFGELSQEGWLTQQGCKLAVARHCTSDYYLVLDAKNHAIRPVHAGMIFNSVGVPKKKFTKTRQDQRPWLDASFAYFGEQNLIPTYRCPASAPPFPINTRVALDLVELIERREGRNIVSFFLSKDDVSTEFTLYIAHITKLGKFRKFMSKGPTTYASLRGRIDQAKIDETVARIDDPDVWCFSVHRRALRDVRERTLETIARAWSVYLFPGYDEAYAAARLLSDRLSGVKDFDDLREAETRGS